MDSESPLWNAHPSHWGYFGWWVLGVVLAPVGLGLLIMLWIAMSRARRTYTITPTKVILETGLWVKDSDELRLKDIRSIAVHRRGLKGWMGVGDIEFSSAAHADADIVFAAAPRVAEVRDLVRRAQEEHDQARPAAAS